MHPRVEVKLFVTGLLLASAVHRLVVVEVPANDPKGGNVIVNDTVTHLNSMDFSSPKGGQTIMKTPGELIFLDE